MAFTNLLFKNSGIKIRLQPTFVESPFGEPLNKTDTNQVNMVEAAAMSEQLPKAKCERDKIGADLVTHYTSKILGYGSTRAHGYAPDGVFYVSTMLSGEHFTFAHELAHNLVSSWNVVV